MSGGARWSQLVQLQHQAPIGDVTAGYLEQGGRQLDPSLEMPVRYLEAMDAGIPHLAGQGPLAADDQHTGAEGPYKLCTKKSWLP